jgi:hypothetical protein
MPEGIGYDIQEQKKDNVGQWKDFLMRPENLATALVLAAGITSERRPNQSKISKFLESSTGALGFRGGLEAGVEAQRATKRDEQRTVEKQAADIVAQQQASAQGGAQVRNQRIAAEAAQQNAGAAVQNAGTQASLAPSTIEGNQAQAGLYDAQAGFLGAQTDALSGNVRPGHYLQKALADELERAAKYGEQPDLPGAILRGKQLEFIMPRVLSGNLTADGKLDISNEELAALGLPSLAEAPPAKAPVKAPEQRKDFRRTGRLISSLLLSEDAESLTAVNTLRRQPALEGLTDDAILDRVEQARILANSKEELLKQTAEELESLLTTYEKVMSGTEARNVRQALRTVRGDSPFKELADIGKFR